MVNLAGDNKCDKTILEELYLAGLKPIQVDKTNTEVPYAYIAKIGNWTFKRAWYYWVASCKKDVTGIPVADALLLHTTKHPTNDCILGDTVRAGGHAGGIYPNEYVAQPVYNDDLNEKLKALGYKEEYWEPLGKMYIPISVGEVAKLCNEGKLQVERYVDCYHIDDQIGLNEFVKFLTKIENKK